MTIEMLEQRLIALEAAVRELQEQLRHQVSRGVLPFIGSMRDYPEFEKAIEYGREFRESDRPPEGDPE